MRAFLSIIDSIMALTLAILLLYVFCIQMPQGMELGVKAQVAYYRKVADQILLNSAMNGHIKDLIDSFELGEPLEPILGRMLSYCPRRLSCSVEVEDPKGLILCSVGENPTPPFGLSSYYTTSRLGTLGIICRVGSR